MLLHMLELGMPVDEVVNVDTGMEFPEMYRISFARQNETA